MKATLVNKDGIAFDTIKVGAKEQAIEWAKNRGNCHLTIEINGNYIDYKIIGNKAHHVAI